MCSLRNIFVFQRDLLIIGAQGTRKTEENNSIEVHGSSLEGITEFLQDSRCPK